MVQPFARCFWLDRCSTTRRLQRNRSNQMKKCTNRYAQDQVASQSRKHDVTFSFAYRIKGKNFNIRSHLLHKSSRRSRQLIVLVFFLQIRPIDCNYSRIQSTILMKQYQICSFSDTYIFQLAMSSIQSLHLNTSSSLACHRPYATQKQNYSEFRSPKHFPQCCSTCLETTSYFTNQEKKCLKQCYKRVKFSRPVGMKL